MIRLIEVTKEDIRNGDSDRSENIITLGFSKISCV